MPKKQKQDDTILEDILEPGDNPEKNDGSKYYPEGLFIYMAEPVDEHKIEALFNKNSKDCIPEGDPWALFVAYHEFLTSRSHEHMKHIEATCDFENSEQKNKHMGYYQRLVWADVHQCTMWYMVYTESKFVPMREFVHCSMKMAWYADALQIKMNKNDFSSAQKIKKMCDTLQKKFDHWHKEAKRSAFFKKRFHRIWYTDAGEVYLTKPGEPNSIIKEKIGRENDYYHLFHVPNQKKKH
jgi:hypothetical protein